MMTSFSPRAAALGGVVGAGLGLMLGFAIFLWPEPKVIVVDSGPRQERTAYYRGPDFDYESIPSLAGEDLADIALLYAKSGATKEAVEAVGSVKDRYLRIRVVTRMAEQVSGQYFGREEVEIDRSEHRLELLKQIRPFVINIISKDELNIGGLRDSKRIEERLRIVSAVVQAQKELANGLLALGAVEDAREMLKSAGVLATHLQEMILDSEPFRSRIKSERSISAVSSQVLGNSASNQTAEMNWTPLIILPAIGAIIGAVALFIISGVTTPILEGMGKAYLGPVIVRTLQNERLAHALEVADDTDETESRRIVKAAPH